MANKVLDYFKGNYYLLISVILCSVCIIHFVLLDEQYPYSNYANPNEIYTGSESISNPTGLLSYLFESRKEHYFSTLKILDNSVIKLALLSLIGIMLLYFQPSDIELFGVKIPNLAVYLILPICILYYWLLFGFSLFNSIASRESLYHLSSQIEKSYFPSKKNYVSQLHQSKNNLEDVSIVDAWSNVFLGFYEEDFEKTFRKKSTNNAKFNYRNTAVAVGLFVIFGGLQGIAMGCAASMIFFYKRRFSGLKRRIVLFEVFLFLYFLLSHLTFFITMPYASIYLASIWFFAAIFFYITIHSLTKDKMNEVSTVNSG